MNCIVQQSGEAEAKAEGGIVNNLRMAELKMDGSST
jgi:hypothetical protein